MIKLTDVLDDIVSKGILNKSEGVDSDVVNQLGLLGARGMIDAALENTAAMTVRTDSQGVLARGVVNKLGVFGTKLGQTLLNDMVPVEVLDERHHIITKSGDDGLNLKGMSSCQCKS
jgi:hypothetical protein